MLFSHPVWTLVVRKPPVAAESSTGPEQPVLRDGKLAVLVCGLLLAVITTPLQADNLPGGDFSTPRSDAEAYLQPGAALSYEQLKRFKRGRKAFEARWVVFPFPAGEWGLGPTFIAERCSDCHTNAGRGSPPATPEIRPQDTLVRLSVPGEDAHGGPKPHPNYGNQFQNRGLTGEDPLAHGYGERVPPEVDISVEWHERAVVLSGGEEVMLRAPKVRFENLRFGPLGDDYMISVRNTPPIFGLGLLEAVPESELLELAEAQKEAGFNGRPNYVWDMVNERRALGRFGWKANVPSVRQQLVSAFIGDIGVTSSLFPEENCPPIQTACREQPPGNNPEFIDGDLSNLEIWTLGLAVPVRRDPDDPEVRRGEKLFGQARCDVCHVPELRTGPHAVMPELAGQLIMPFTDLLLHDMGEELADGRPDYQAGPRDWRTAPLWGLGLSETVSNSMALLHDGRARNVTEAILWHGGEAEAARDAFAQMPRADRDALLRFVMSL